MSDASDLTSRVRAVVRRSGADRVGVCSADPFPEVRRHLERRVAGGLSAGMSFTFADPARATDPRASFPWAARLLVAGRAYLPEAGSPGAGPPGWGRVARFAVDDSYRPLAGALEEGAAWLRGAGHRAEVLVDDNRLVDRAAAVRAGLGWWGKNTMVLAPGQGPWMLLGSVVTDAPLTLDAPMARDCGTCSACLPACPTGALIAPGVLDARRCLSAVAQRPGPIPLELRPAMGDRLYGCDDCLEACPPGGRLEASSPAGRGRVDLAGLLDMRDEELLSAFSRFYIPRRDPRYLRRNALVALGNAGGAEHVPLLVRHLHHQDPLLRGHAAWALGRLGGEEATHALSDALAEEADPGVREEVGLALAQLVPRGK